MRAHSKRLGAFALFFLLAGGPLLSAAVYPQAGIEAYFGANRLRLWKPWIALRFGLSDRASLLLKYYHHRLSFDYSVFEEDAVFERTREASFSNLTAAIFLQKGATSGSAAVSYLLGTEGYRGLVLDAGVSQKFGPRFEVEGGIYVISESSVLWYPTEAARDIAIYSLKGGIKIGLIPDKLILNPKVSVYRNSEKVNAASYAVGLIVSPKYPFYITLDYYRYTEAAVYRFAGDYVSATLNIYY